MNSPLLKIARLDLYKGAENQGMRCLPELLSKFADHAGEEVSWNEFEVRKK